MRYMLQGEKENEKGQMRQNAALASKTCENARAGRSECRRSCSPLLLCTSQLLMLCCRKNGKREPLVVRGMLDSFFHSLFVPVPCYMVDMTGVTKKRRRVGKYMCMYVPKKIRDGYGWSRGDEAREMR